jgi:hypothetical protein
MLLVAAVLNRLSGAVGTEIHRSGVPITITAVGSSSMTLSATLRSWSGNCAASALHIRRKLKTADWAAVHRPRRQPQDPPAR